MRRVNDAEMEIVNSLSGLTRILSEKKTIQGEKKKTGAFKTYAIHWVPAGL